MPTRSQRNFCTFFWEREFEAEVNMGSERLMSLLLNWILIHLYFWKWFNYGMQTLFQRTKTISETYWPSSMHSASFKKCLSCHDPFMESISFLVHNITIWQELRSHCEMVSTAVVLAEKCSKGLQKLCHFLLQPICALNTGAQFKDTSSLFIISFLWPQLFFIYSDIPVPLIGTTLLSSEKYIYPFPDWHEGEQLQALLSPSAVLLWLWLFIFAERLLFFFSF